MPRAKKSVVLRKRLVILPRVKRGKVVVDFEFTVARLDVCFPSDALND